MGEIKKGKFNISSDLFNEKENSAPAQAVSAMIDTAPMTKEQIIEIDIALLQEIEDQPFSLHSEEQIEKLAKDIQENGLLSPLVVQPKDGMYRILSGRNRFRACKQLGKSEIPCIIRDVGDDQAMLILVNSNLNQRHELKPSEKALAYQMQKRYSKRVPAERAGEEQESEKTIFRYLRLAQLNSGLLELVDQKQITMKAGVELSYLREESQNRLFQYLEVYPTKIDEGKAKALRNTEIGGPLQEKDFKDLFRRKTKDGVSFRLPPEIKEYLPLDDTKEKQTEFIIEAIKQYCQSN